MTKTYKIPCSWTMYGNCVVEAESFEEAMEIAADGALPDRDSYLDDSWVADKDASLILAINPDLSEEDQKAVSEHCFSKD